MSIKMSKRSADIATPAYQVHEDLGPFRTLTDAKLAVAAAARGATDE